MVYTTPYVQICTPYVQTCTLETTSIHEHLLPRKYNSANMAQNTHAMIEVSHDRRSVMVEVSNGLQEAGFPALDAKDWEIAGCADKPDNLSTIQQIADSDVCDALSVESVGDSVFGEHSGQSSVTARFVRRELTVRQAIRELDDNGQIVPILNEAFDRVDDKSVAMNITQFILWQFAKGWVAERALAESDRFAKMAESNDIGGQDLYDRESDNPVQVKSVSRGYKPGAWGKRPSLEGSRGNYRDENGVPVLFYQFDDSGHLVVGKDHCKTNARAAERAGNKKTAHWRDRMW